MIDIDGNPDDIWSADVTLALMVGNPDGLDVILALALEIPDGVEPSNPDRSETLGRGKGGTVGVEMLDEIVGSPEGIDAANPEDVPIAVLFEEILGSPDEGDPLDEVLLDEIVRSPDEAEMVETPVNELLEDIVGNPEAAVVDVAGITDGAELLASPVDEMFKERVWDPEGAIELWSPDRFALGWVKGGTIGEELLTEVVGIPDGAEEASITDELKEGSEETLTLGSKVGVTELFMEAEMLPERLTVGLTLDVAFVVTFGNPLIRTALIV